MFDKKQALTAKKQHALLTDLHKHANTIRDSCLRLEKPPIIPDVLAHKIAAIEHDLAGNPASLPVQSWLLLQDSKRTLDALHTKLQLHLQLAPGALHSRTTQAMQEAWVQDLQMILVQRRQLAAEIEQLRDDIPSELHNMLTRRTTGKRRPGGGRPVGGKLTPEQWRERLDPYIDDIGYDRNTGELAYRGRIIKPDADRITPARVPVAVAIPLVMGHSAVAKQTRPPSWAWATLRLTERAGGLPDCDSDGSNPTPLTLMPQLA